MSDQPQVKLIEFSKVKQLSREQWNAAVKSAQDEIKGLHPIPALEDFTRRNESGYPLAFIVGQWVFLIVAMLTSLWVSAGKQIEVADAIFKTVTTDATFLGDFWRHTSLIAIVVLGEVGALGFSLAVALVDDELDDELTEDVSREHAIAKFIFRGFSFACAGMALLANVTLTVKHPEGSFFSGAFQWALTFIIPGLVLGIGFYGEHMIMKWLRWLRKARLHYSKARRDAEVIHKHPELYKTESEAYIDFLYRSVMQSIAVIQGQYRRMFEYTCSVDEDFAHKVFLRDYHKHTIRLKVEVEPRPTMPHSPNETGTGASENSSPNSAGPTTF